jgi:hypothetical protein
MEKDALLDLPRGRRQNASAFGDGSRRPGEKRLGREATTPA